MKRKEWSRLSEELKKGNNQVLGVFFKEYAEYCCHRLSAENACTEDDARDFFIESVMSLRERIIREPELPVNNIRAFLFRACHNMFLSSLRSKKKERSAITDIERFYYDSQYHHESQAIFNEELLSVTLRAWSQLSERCQDLLHFFYVDRLRMKEIARLMGLANEEVAKSTKARCYKRLLAKARTLKEQSNIKP